LILLLVLIDVVVNEFRLRSSLLKSRLAVLVKILVRRIFVRKSERLSFFLHRLAFVSFKILRLWIGTFKVLRLWYMRRRRETLMLFLLVLLSPESKIVLFAENLSSLVKRRQRRKVVELFGHFRPRNGIAHRRVWRRGRRLRPVLVFEDRGRINSGRKASYLVGWKDRLVRVVAVFVETGIPSKETLI
jgi:hypothetical protein